MSLLQALGIADTAQEAEDGENVQVMVRVRPLNTRETASDMKSCVRVLGSRSLFLSAPEAGQIPGQYTFDYVAGEDMDQEGLFDGKFVVSQPFQWSAFPGHAHVCNRLVI